jgi:hypothetical protein
VEPRIDTLSADENLAEHQETYRKFVKLARTAACAAPFFVAFVIYWTT